jgi:hypothetical protein
MGTNRSWIPRQTELGRRRRRLSDPSSDAVVALQPRIDRNDACGNATQRATWIATSTSRP